jgi:HEAT repeat protein
MHFFDGKEPGFRALAALAIGRLSGDRREAVGALIEALADRNLSVRAAAALTMGEIGPAARSALPALRALLRDTRNNVPNLLRNVSGLSAPIEYPDEFSQLLPQDVEWRDLSVAGAARRAIAAIEPSESPGRGDP